MRNRYIRESSTFFGLPYLRTTDRWMCARPCRRDEYRWKCPRRSLEAHSCFREWMIVILTIWYTPLLVLTLSSSTTLTPAATDKFHQFLPSRV